MLELIILLFAFLCGFVVCGLLLLALIWVFTLIKEHNERKLAEVERQETQERSHEFKVESCWDRLPEEVPWRPESSTGFGKDAA